jgi:Domain of unknown function (DUF4111)/Nucleotidyltransferase domain
MAGLYVFGSLVVGDFDADVSDIDLLAVLTGDPSEDLVARLGLMHDALASENPVWAGRIEVIYVSAGDPQTAHAYAVLTMCRGLYTLRVGGQPSKVMAATWAQHELPEWAR